MPKDSLSITDNRTGKSYEVPIQNGCIKTADLLSRVTPAIGIGLAPREDGRDPMFVATLDYLLEQHKLVEPLYQLEKAGKFSRGKEEEPTPEGRAFIEKQLLVGGAQLAAIWQTQVVRRVR